MLGWIIGISVYMLFGFIYGTVMLFLIISEDANDETGEFDSGGARILSFVFCVIFWIIFIPITIIYRIYNKIKGGN